MAPWMPSAESVATVAAVKTVLEEYRAHLPLTLRQVFYRLVATFGFDKTEKSYKRLGEVLNRARRAGFVRFEDIRDDGVTVVNPRAWDNAEAFRQGVSAGARAFRLDRQHSQPVRLLIAVEAGGMVPQIARVADEFGVSVQSSGGFDSVTAKHDLALLLSEWPAAEVLHIGDYDPSGEHVFGSLSSDVSQFLVDMGIKEAIAARRTTFTRLAVTPAQIDEMDLPTAPPKVTDRRRFDDTRTVQAEAIPPERLNEIVRRAIVERIDMNAYARTLQREYDERAELVAWIESREFRGE